MRPAFERARAGDQHERQIVADPHVPDRHMPRVHRRSPPMRHPGAGREGGHVDGSDLNGRIGHAVRGHRRMIAPVEECGYNCRATRAGGFAMIRFAALLVAVSVLAVSIPAVADGVPREKRPAVTKKIKKKANSPEERLSSRKRSSSRKQRRRRSSSRRLLRRRRPADPGLCLDAGTLDLELADEHACLGSRHVYLTAFARGRAEPRVMAYRQMDRHRPRRLIAVPFRRF